MATLLHRPSHTVPGMLCETHTPPNVAGISRGADSQSPRAHKGGLTLRFTSELCSRRPSQGEAAAAWIFLRCTGLITDGHGTSSPSTICRSSGLSMPSCANASAYNLASLALTPHLSVSHVATCWPMESSSTAACSVDAFFFPASAVADSLAAAAAAATGVAMGTATCIWTPPPCVAGAVEEAVVGVTFFLLTRQQ